MIDVDTFITILYVMVDDFCQQHLPPEPKRPGPQASLARSEVVTLAWFAQWAEFKSERGFYRFAQRHLRPASQPCQIAANLIACCEHIMRLLSPLEIFC
jgi:hypothetical protein